MAWSPATFVLLQHKNIGTAAQSCSTVRHAHPRSHTRFVNTQRIKYKANPHQCRQWPREITVHPILANKWRWSCAFAVLFYFRKQWQLSFCFLRGAGTFWVFWGGTTLRSSIGIKRNAHNLSVFAWCCFPLFSPELITRSRHIRMIQSAYAALHAHQQA